LGEAVFNEGVTLLANGQPEAALQEFQKSLDAAIGDQKADSFYNIAVCHARLGNADKAVEAATEALAIDPSLARDIEADADLAELAAGKRFQPILKAAARRAALVGLDGWLFVAGIGLLLTVILGGAGLVAMLRTYSDVAATRYAGLYTLEMFAGAGVFAFSVYATVRFFGKKRNAPAAIIGLLVGNIAVTALLLLIELNAGATLLAVANTGALVQGVIAAAIWIPYFRVSKRVKATFRTDSSS
jgi:tetratricopeptide (TPR) repeat protein